MADVLRHVFGLFDKRYRDMHDGSKAEVVSAALPAGTGVYLIDDSGEIVGVRHIDHKLFTASKPFLYEIAEGQVPGCTAVRRAGYNDDVGTTPETVSIIGGLMYYPAAAEILKFSSDDPNDDGAPAGTGAHTLWIQGLDANWALQQDTITLNGTTLVEANKAFIRAFKLKVLTAGDSGHNEGTVTAYGNDGVSKMLAIAEMEDESQSATFSVPAGQTLFVVCVTISDASLKGGHIQLWQRPYGSLWYVKRNYSLLDNTQPVPANLPLVFGEKSDIEMRARGLTAGAVASAGFEGWRE